ncbi:hypothetical protein GGI25_005554 [Coemansia spiralis]|uniref:Major facilitator superfamily (MFS) profile domain-containing protein n=2 Tax=Coemansia TaxID=4863 RepID=A0A9W8G4B7_9FUNG|nr:major facilitator superfamily domain-containing protein [Coemansia spiralis]KAJ1987840.1 hypothetical protein EDC05_005621 [Coemansia umbellata]KAJ2622651.1 hypothetical protein GGI26_003097 [Coemansia sp. RSA 1358]KAJ2671281.1 hypothetical protein GGI25_005554 [Coemansia spiralis]
MAALVASPETPLAEQRAKQVTRIVFIALLLDILAFTIILPLLPRSLEAYKQREGADPSTLLGSTLARVGHLRTMLNSTRFLQDPRADIVLLGGLLGSLYSLLQCLVAPVIGRLADRWGRRRTLLLCMAGNLVWTIVWVFAGRFETFLVARIIAGLSEGNVQLSNTIIADVTGRTTRSRGMALVGIAFAVGFTVGPSIGAFFAHVLEPSRDWAPFVPAALFSLMLLAIETAYLFAKLPETQKPPAAATTQAPQRPSILRRLNYLHFLYLFFFSGMEYTLTFLTHDRFDFTNMQQGRLLGFIGIVSTVIQGGYVRRFQGDRRMVAQGMVGCALGLFAIAVCCFNSTRRDGSTVWLWGGSLGLALASATVVSCLNSIVSLVAGSANETGRRLGDFRSAGQFGRAFGPVFACSVYWLAGPTTCYAVGAIAVSLIAVAFVSIVPRDFASAEPRQKTD